MKSITFLRFLSLALCLILLQGCAGARNSVSTDGSTSMEKAVGCLGEMFSKNTGIRFSFNPTGSGAGITAVAEGRCDIGLSSRELKESEVARGLVSTVIAYDAIALIVNPENPVTDLTVEQIFDIYTGKVTNWSQVGGNDLPIVLIGRESGSGTRDGFESVTGTKDACLYRQELTSSGDVITTVANNPSAVGYASVASVKDSVRILTVGGVYPEESSVSSNEYPLQRPFVLVTLKDRPLSENAQKFYDYATSEDAHDMIRLAGVYPVAIP